MKKDMIANVPVDTVTPGHKLWFVTNSLNMVSGKYGNYIIPVIEIKFRQ